MECPVYAVLTAEWFIPDKSLRWKSILPERKQNPSEQRHYIQFVFHKRLRPVCDFCLPKRFRPVAEMLEWSFSSFRDPYLSQLRTCTTMTEIKPSLPKAFDPESFREQGHKLVDTLADFLKSSLKGEIKRVLPAIDPEAMLARWPGDFPKTPSEDYEEIVARVLDDSNNLQHPRYIGHQCCTPLPLTALNDLLGSFMNNGSAIYEMGPANVAMEKRLVQWMCRLIGYGDDADGVFTNGGTVGNLTALLAARQCKAEYDVWKEGLSRGKPMAVLVSTQCHYSVKRAVGVMGLGEDAVLLVPCDDRYHMDLDAAHDIYRKATEQGKHVFAVVGNGCSTATGSYDDLNAIADFAEKHDLWFHVDAAHGASALLSEKYRHYLNGLDRADSMVWDAHKMLMIPALVTAVIFKKAAHSYQSYSQKASYLFEKEATDEWYNYAHRTMECTKNMMGGRMYMALSVLGTDLFADFVTYMYDLTRDFAEVIDAADDFELAVRPESNIICFRYLDPRCRDARDLDPGADDLDALQRKIRRDVLKTEAFYIVQTELENGTFLRCTLINPNTRLDDLKALLELIRSSQSGDGIRTNSKNE